MATISNDHDLREALSALSSEQQRIMGARFAQSVMHLCKDDRVRRAADTAMNPDAADTELEDAWKAAKAYAARTYTECGKDCDWLSQADHFVAGAVAGALTPPGHQLSENINPAWKAAVQARMAKNCEMMVEVEGQEENESESQYRIARESL
jgi:hypothetical protein